MASKDRTSLRDKPAAGQGAAALSIGAPPLASPKTVEVAEPEVVSPTSPLVDEDKFKLTLYVNREIVDDVDVEFARLKRGRKVRRSRSDMIEAALRVALRDPEKIISELYGT